MGMWLLMSAYQGLCVRYQNFQVVGVGLELQEEGVGLQVEGVGLGCSTFWEEVEEEGEWAAGERQVQRTIIIIIIYSCCCRSAYAIDHAPTDAGGACKISSQRTRARTTRDHTILITIQFLLPSLPYQ